MRKYVIFFLGFIFFTLIIEAQHPGESKSFNTNLPLIIIDTYGAEIIDEPKIQAHMGIINNLNGINNISDPFSDYDGTIGIEKRGSTSQMFEKMSYGFETRTVDGKNKNVSLLGLPAENDWVLYAPYSDKALIRNALTYILGNELGRWNPHVRFCELYINDDYRGLYVLIEKIKHDVNRLNLEKLTSDEISGEDLTGGYILNIDRPDKYYWMSPYPGKTGLEIVINYIYPDDSLMPSQQKTYIRDYVTSFEESLKGEGYSDPVNGYRSYVDVSSFVDFFLFNELGRNIDAYRLSTFFYKDKNKKLTMGPLWDFDLAFGNANYYEGFNTEGWVIYDNYLEDDDTDVPFWWERLRTDFYFNFSIKTRWDFLRKGSFSRDHIFKIIDSLSVLVNSAKDRNFERFPILGVYVWPVYFIGQTYEDEINYLKEWITGRLDWMDSQIALITSVKENQNANVYETYAYPNPFSDQVAIRTTLFHPAKIGLTVTNLLGQIIYEREDYCLPGPNEFVIPEDSFKDGSGIFIYMIRINTKSIITGKIIRK